MKLRELLQEMDDIRNKLGINPFFIAGGTPRDKYMNRLDNINDLDITTGNKDVDYFSQEFYLQFKKQFNIKRTTATDGHSSIFIGDLKIDFSSNFIVPNIDQYLQKLGVKKIDNLKREVFSRDFTCNSLLLTSDLKQILDPTGRGFKDIKEKKIRTCLDPSITLSSNKNRVIRSIYLACKLDFDIDESIIQYVLRNPNVIKISTERVMKEKLNQAFSKNPKKAANLISKMKLWNYIPITEIVYPYYQAHIAKEGVLNA